MPLVLLKDTASHLTFSCGKSSSSSTPCPEFCLATKINEAANGQKKNRNIDTYPKQSNGAIAVNRDIYVYIYIYIYIIDYKLV